MSRTTTTSLVYNDTRERTHVCVCRNIFVHYFFLIIDIDILLNRDGMCFIKREKKIRFKPTEVGNLFTRKGPAVCIFSSRATPTTLEQKTIVTENISTIQTTRDPRIFFRAGAYWSSYILTLGVKRVPDRRLRIVHFTALRPSFPHRVLWFVRLSSNHACPMTTTFREAPCPGCSGRSPPVKRDSWAPPPRDRVVSNWFIIGMRALHWKRKPSAAAAMKKKTLNLIIKTGKERKKETFIFRWKHVVYEKIIIRRTTTTTTTLFAPAARATQQQNRCSVVVPRLSNTNTIIIINSRPERDILYKRYLL